ncbi:glycosyl hydrolase family 28-related protein [Mucilaginibacter celer]|uniref:Rhamnogalacturonase A/B/Epimerase-like pectate lyase domain-containing protein n=1 Tax=Mucilaginibacter celer TaxID=2305508 RepID=A0A494VIC5_9SPHI|nr:hypothetical protein [Mucilaginibacter celer]AYL94567.1 hypothetical protein HYN43_004300 [Mucilaginibacter celer]
MIQTTIQGIRDFTGTITDPIFYTTDINQEGNWRYDPNDTTSADDTGSILVTADGKRVKRIYEGVFDVKWFGAKANFASASSQFVLASATAGSLIANGSNSFTISTGQFSSSDVGKIINIRYSNDANTNFITSTITAVASATQITLNNNSTFDLPSAAQIAGAQPDEKLTVTVLYGNDDTAAIQKAIDASFALKVYKQPQVYLSAGSYFVTQLVMKTGTQFYGDGATQQNIRAQSKLYQIPGSNADVIRVESGANTTGALFWSGFLHDFSIMGNPSNTGGWGISIRNTDGSRVSPADITMIQRLTVRYMPSGGIEFPLAGIPLFVTDIKLYCNGGPGIGLGSKEGSEGKKHAQSVNLTNISADSNVGAAIKINNLDMNSNVVIVNLKCEDFAINPYDTSVPKVTVQPYPVLIDNCQGTGITLLGANNQGPTTSGSLKVKSTIKSTNSSPNILWNNCYSRITSANDVPLDPDPEIVEGSGIPYTTFFGTYPNFNLATTFTQSHRTPLIRLIKTDNIDDEKVWDYRLSSTRLELGINNDALNQFKPVIQFQRTGNNVKGVYYPNKIIRIPIAGSIPTLSGNPVTAADSSLYELINTSALNMPTISGSLIGQELELIFDGFTTIVHGTGNITLASGANFKPAAGQIVRFIKGNTTWLEVGGASCTPTALAITNTTTSALSKSSLNSSYPAAIVGTKVVCASITGGGIVYEKVDNSSTGNWISSAMIS